MPTTLLTGSDKVTRLSITITKKDERCNWTLKTSGISLACELARTRSVGAVEDLCRADAGGGCFSHKQKRSWYATNFPSEERSHPGAHPCVFPLTCHVADALHWMSCSGIGIAPRKLIEELRFVKSLDVLLPTRDKTIRLRIVSKVSKDLQPLLQRHSCRYRSNRK